MSEQFRFFSLPLEIREMIWTYAVPDRIVEVGQPGDPDALPPSDLKKAWIQNHKPPTVALICKESRDIAMKSSGAPRGEFTSFAKDYQYWLKSTKTIHFNTEDESEMGMPMNLRLENDMLDMLKVVHRGKELSISADLIQPFIRFHNASSCSGLMQHVLFDERVACTIALQTVMIKATHAQARRFGLFGGGDEAAQLVDPEDDETLNKFKDLWILSDGSHDMTAAKFFETVGGPRFDFRIKRWRAELAIKFIQWSLRFNPFGAPQLTHNAAQAIQWLRQNFDLRQNHAVQELLDDFPEFKLRIMFRLCPPRARRNMIM
ncbi:unnamed protein product [Penicillium salamii]|uniref:2EXR domain-containing protein n=1 Tax=Penicillium salamii TaxID=1612424 RepID=A0A9W4NMI9_9EURO|nr:unnamed protein product [Penicillium salamii]CAG7984150.1 unnamed protein product [Penicillium salamii]CAG8019882.1 unnamed protein product [Penicillium salamii]CAG8029262.1 unnamed protein product [Penicillium salamii]CAG8077223.1 unnamed protein product [Penicillium salamii]